MKFLPDSLPCPRCDGSLIVTRQRSTLSDGEILVEFAIAPHTCTPVTTPFDDPIVRACVAHGGHFWPPDAPEGEPSTCTRCWYNPGWKAGKPRHLRAPRPVHDEPQA